MAKAQLPQLTNEELALLQQIQEFPSATVQPGVGIAVRLVVTRKNGLKVTSFWAGRPNAVPTLKSVLAQLQAGA